MNPKKFVTRSIIRADRQPLELVGVATTDAPSASAADEARVYYDKTTSELMTSKSAGTAAIVPTGCTSTELAKLSGITGYPVQVAEVNFTETAGAGVYTGAVSLPAAATIHDIIINGIALWTAATSATMKVGDTDDDGFYTGIDLKATDLLAGESISFALAGGKAGAYIANSQVSPRWSVSARTINGIVTTVGGSGTAGRTRMLVVWSVSAQTNATKV